MGDLNIDLGSVVEETPIADKSVTIYNSGVFVSVLNFVVQSDSSWLTVDPTSGIDGGGDASGIDLIVSIDTTGLAAGSYTGILAVTDSFATNSPFTVEFSLTITAAP